MQVVEAIAALVSIATVGVLVYRALGGAAAPTLGVGLLTEAAPRHHGVVFASDDTALHEVESVGFDRSPLGPPTPWRMVIRTQTAEQKIPAWGRVYRLPNGAEVTGGARPPWVSPQRYPSPDVLPLVRFFRDRGLAVRTETEAPTQKDLLRSRPAGVLLGVALVAVVYAAAEDLLGTETYVSPAATRCQCSASLPKRRPPCGCVTEGD